MHSDRPCGALQQEDRQLVYARARISESAARLIEGMVVCSPARRPGKAALNNVVTRFNSLKNSATRVLESHTCELVFAYELELDPDVLGYYAQVPCRNVQRTLPNGRRHISSACIDFLVFRKHTVQLVECKPLGWLEAAAKDDKDWYLAEGRWGHGAYEGFARGHDLEFSIWSPPEHVGVYLQNLEAMYSALRGDAVPLSERVVAKAHRRICTQPTSIKDLADEIDGFSARTAIWMLATRQVFGPLKSTSVQATESFTLCADAEQANLIDHLGLEASLSVYAQPELSNPILRASATDLRKGRERWERVQSMRRGEIPWTVRMAQLDREVTKLETKGRNPLVACLTNFSSSGNRQSRLQLEQEFAAEKVIAQLWNRGKVRTRKNLYYAYQDECAARGIHASGRTSLNTRVRRENAANRALATGGLRGYQDVRPATDPTRRSLPALGFGHTLFVDSSDFDNRCAPDLAKQMPAQKGKFYIGVDGASEMTMAHALVFGAARTDGLAILMREYQRRWGRLPCLFHLDRGPENTSEWAGAFAEAYQVSLRFSPTAGSAWNGLAESTIKRVNNYVAHELTGSTLPDRKGRSVDGRFKSYRNAKTTFDVIREQFLIYAYEDHPATPGSDGLTPRQRQDEACTLLGDFGVECAYDEDFLLATSIPMTLKRNVDKRRGVRTEEGFFTSDELLDALRFHDAEEARSDCEDPTVIRVRVGATWIKAFHSRVQSIALLKPEDKLFDLLYAPIRRAEARLRKEKIDKIRYTRMQKANFAGTAVLPPSSTTSIQPEAVPAIDAATQRAEWDALEPLTQQESNP